MRRKSREMSVEEFDDWLAATKQFEAVAEAADEEGGPRLSLVPVTQREDVWPTDLLPPAATGESADGAPAGAVGPEPAAVEPVTAMPFDGVELEDSRKRLAGWSGDRQRIFLTHLAETGSVHLACASARLTARSAYKLRMRSPAFAAAWDTAEQLAAGRLSAIAFDRAINGRVEQVWHQGELMMEKRLPSDKLLMWLLARLDPRRYAAPWELRGDGADPQAAARAGFAGQLDGLTDLPVG
ncbi:hypothetical protein [Sphingomonas bacterium]|uniref:hypothetical protein n=1 Tax=Sphingomonas bacterium TaxID=1895847 RepID=UPI00262A3131|nr:hypothetical protein [Sphingomonas bacterium]MDB5679631.1 hypothetical protein [Sphingomonas bacterium]